MFAKKTNKDRQYRGGGPRPDLNKVKRAEAKERQEGYNNLSAEEKIAKLDRKFGVGLGAAKERAKIASPVSVVKAETKSKPREIVAVDEPKIVVENKKMKAKDRRKAEQGKGSPSVSFEVKDEE